MASRGTGQMRRVQAARSLRQSTEPKKANSAAGCWLKAGAAILVLTTLMLLFLGFAAGAAAAAYSYYANSLPSPERVIQHETFKSAMIYDRHGTLLYEAWDPNAGRRTVVPLDQMSPHLIDATLSTEDPNFYENPGFDIKSIIRAAWQNLTNNRVMSGSSTITMQLIRQTVLDPEERLSQTYTRKIKEAILAYQLSRTYTKDQILQMYLNEIYYGNNSYGVEAAAESYFGKSAKDLDLAEAAMLAGLPSSPVNLDPITNYRGAKQRQEAVLDLMVRHGYATPLDAWNAKREKLNFAAQETEIRAPHFVWYVRDQLERRFGREKLYSGGLRVSTTLDLPMQEMAENVARSQLEKIRQNNANNAAIVAMDPKTAEILVMVGSADYYNADIDGQVNMALAERQPGSTLKPFTYLLAFSKGMAPASIIVDEPRSFPGGAGQPDYRPKNHDNRFLGPISLRRALAGSRNIPAVLILQRVGIPNLLDLLHQAGITTLTDPNRYGLALTLGGGEVKLLDMVYAYSSLANYGLQFGAPVPANERQPGYREYEPVAITKVTDADGKVLYEYKPSAGKQLFPPQLAFLITNVLSDDEARVDTYGRHSVLELSRPDAAKTGTTDDYRDGWTLGYTPDLVAGVWIGNADNEPMTNILAVAGAGKIWHDFMEAAIKDTPVHDFLVPPGVVKATVSRRTGLRAGPGVPGVTDWFLEGMAPTETEILTPTPSPTATPAPTGTPTRTRTPVRPTQPTPSSVSGDRVVVPDVVRLPEAEARRRIEAAGLRNSFTNYQSEQDVAPSSREFFRSVPPGSVLSQSPPAGTLVAPGTTINIAVRKQ
ncbi:MAG: PBP1A family penicillin-binding protein [Bacteroidetes bacterium]|nr:PBP1A family penicillin-binding protein [Bacteroidota bacterium]